MRTGKSILFVDDEIRDLGPLVRLLNVDEEYQIKAANESEAISEIKNTTYDYVSLDIDMGEKRGELVYEELREIDKRSVIFVLTGLASFDKRVRWFMERGIWVFFKTDPDVIDKIRAYITRCKFDEPKDLSVLIIDDEKTKQETYVKLLEDIGFINITRCFSPEEAEQLLETEAFDIYVVDMCYEHADESDIRGPEIVSFLQQNDSYANCVVIPVTTKAVARDSLDKLEDDNVHPLFLDKQDTFTAKIEKLLGRRRFKTQNA